MAQSEGLGTGEQSWAQFPLAQREACAEPATKAARRRIVVVEDSDELGETMREFLESLGHEVEICCNGEEGAARLIAQAPDVALIDIGLPGIDGYEVARRVRAAPGRQGLYLVALTGYASAAAGAKARAAGFDLHLPKPVNVAELPEVVMRSR